MNTINKNNLVDSLVTNHLVSCDLERPWVNGSKFMSYLKTKYLNGLTGYIGFDNVTRFRKNFTLAILEKTSLQFSESSDMELVIFMFMNSRDWFYKPLNELCVFRKKFLVDICF